VTPSSQIGVWLVFWYQAAGASDRGYIRASADLLLRLAEYTLYKFGVVNPPDLQETEQANKTDFKLTRSEVSESRIDPTAIFYIWSRD
jgi:hypothetical protein